jgi:GNAT superfamily N-acetyltransferase
MVTEFQIRETRIEDLPILLHHRRAMFQEMGFTDPEALDGTIRHSEPFMRQGIVEGFYRGWVAETGGRIAAGAGLVVIPWFASPTNLVPRLAYILNVYTEPAYRRQGLSRRLVNTIIDWCRAQNLGMIHLHASDAGRGLYESLGFKASNEMSLRLKG